MAHCSCSSAQSVVEVVVAPRNQFYSRPILPSLNTVFFFFVDPKSRQPASSWIERLIPFFCLFLWANERLFRCSSVALRWALPYISFLITIRLKDADRLNWREKKRTKPESGGTGCLGGNHFMDCYTLKLASFYRLIVCWVRLVSFFIEMHHLLLGQELLPTPVGKVHNLGEMFLFWWEWNRCSLLEISFWCCELLEQVVWLLKHSALMFSI